MDEQKLPRAPNPDGTFAVDGRTWNTLCDMVEASAFTVGTGLSLDRSPAGGRMLSSNLADRVRPIRITGTNATGGMYIGRALVGSATSFATNGASFTMPAGMTDTGIDDALILNLPEAAGTNTAHGLATSGASSYGCGLLVGMTQESTPRKEFIWIASSIPSYKPGKLKTAWVPGSGTVTLTPVVALNSTNTTGGPDVTVNIVFPLANGTNSVCSFFDLNVGEIAVFFDTGIKLATNSTSTELALLNPPTAPRNGAQYDVMINQAIGKAHYVSGPLQTSA